MTRALPPALARGLVFLWLVALLLGAVALGVGLGAVAVPPEAVVRALLGLEENPIVTELRLPRVLAGVLVGAALGVSGAAFQGLFRNPLADPYLMGSASGAAFAVTLFASLLGGLSPAFSQHAVFQHLPLSATFFGFVGALSATLLTLVLAGGGPHRGARAGWGGGGERPHRAHHLPDDAGRRPGAGGLRLHPGQPGLRRMGGGAAPRPLLRPGLPPSSSWAGC